MGRGRKRGRDPEGGAKGGCQCWGGFDSSSGPRCCCCVRLCPQWPDRCCFCFSREGGVVLTGILTVLDNVCVIVACIYAIVKPEFWAEGYKAVETWVVSNHWDTDVTHGALRVLGQINANRQAVLIAFACYSALAIVSAGLLILSGRACSSGSAGRGGAGRRRIRRRLMLPWLCQDFLTITLVALAFIAWAFLSFFVHVLLAVLFPVVSGAILGLYIYLWRNVREVYEAAAAAAAAEAPHRGHNHLEELRKISAGFPPMAAAADSDVNSMMMTYRKQLQAGGGGSVVSGTSSSGIPRHLIIP